MIRLTIPSIEEDDLQAVRDVLLTGFLVQGVKVAAFEKAVAKYVGVEHAVAVSNCTAALHLALLALDTRPGDLVVVTAYSWIATANVIELCGAQPIFVDIHPDTFNMDPDCLDNTLQRLMACDEMARRVKAVLPVHTFGQMADMPAILELADKYRLPVIEDAACALGATLNGQQAGTWGIMGCFSFHPRKAITSGEGGIIVTSDTHLARRLRALRNHGQDPEYSSTDIILPGFNYRLTEFQAALGLTQMAKLDRIITARHRSAACYDILLKDAPLQIPMVAQDSQPVYQSYVVLLPEKIGACRGKIITRLKEQEIETTIGTWHMPMTTYFRFRYGYRTGDFPTTDRVFDYSMTLPLYEGMQKVEQEEVVCALLGLLQEVDLD